MKKYISFLLVAALFAACTPQNEVGTPFKAGQEVTLTAHMPNAGNNGAQQLPSKQRVSGKDAGTQIDLTWDTGDKIKVTVGDKSATFTLASGAGSAQATFTGIMPADGVTYSVQYPIAEPDLSVQTYLEDGFGKGLMKMATETNGTIDGGFTLKAQHALLGLQLKGSDALGKIVLTNLADSKTYTLDCSGVTLTDEAALFYIVVPAGDWANGFKVDVYADDNSTIIKTLTKTGSVSFYATQTMNMPEQAIATDGYQGIGIFSVAEGKTVTFSPGNLQYTRSTETWSFASAQYEMIGTANVTGGNVTSDSGQGDIKFGDALADKVDLFGWSTSATNFGVSTSMDDNDYSGSFVDWGANTIGDDAPNTWRTLTYDEWSYVVFNRPNASNLKGVAQVNGVNGLILLPDNWNSPSGATFKSGLHSNSGVDYYADYQNFTAEQWSKFEAAGAVFIPTSGNRRGSSVLYVQYYGYYWSATEDNSNYALCLGFRSNAAYKHSHDRYYGLSVRLVKDVEAPDIPENTDPYNGHEYVDLGLSVKWATCNVGASKPEEYGDYFAWGEVEPKDTYDWSTYKWCNGSYNTQTKYNINSSFGTVDNKTTLDLSDDAARANWGGSWRMPTKAEQDELRTECTWTWTTENGVNGYRVTSNKAGYTDKSIFLPAAGYRSSSLNYAGSIGEYWSSSLNTDSPGSAGGLDFISSSYVGCGSYGRNCGQSVRPVCQ